MQIDLNKREIELDQNTSSEGLYKNLKGLWVKNVQYSSIPFPLEQVEDTDVFVLKYQWKLSEKSHAHIRDGKIIMPRPQRPDFPVSPKTVIQYEGRYFDKPVILEEVLRHVPQEVPLSMVRLIGGPYGSVTLSVPGHWPNYHLQEDTLKHRREIRQWESDVLKYEDDLKLWDEVKDE